MKASQYVWELRKKLNISQLQLARALGVTEQTVYNWERVSIAVPTLPNDAAAKRRVEKTANARATKEDRHFGCRGGNRDTFERVVR